MTITEHSTWEGHALTVTWDDAPTLPPRELITQASGVCFTNTGQVVLVSSGDGRWALPGGHPEAGETIAATLAREVREEACAIVEQCCYLGAQCVVDPALPTPYYQTRWWARVRLLPIAPVHEITERLLVNPDAVVALLGWNTERIAQALLDAALAQEAKAR